MRESSCLRIRKLTPLECLKLMGFDENDYKSLVEWGQSDSSIYHCSGDSLGVTLFACLVGEMTDIDYRKRVEDYIETLKD